MLKEVTNFSVLFFYQCSLYVHTYVSLYIIGLLLDPLNLGLLAEMVNLGLAYV